MSYYRLDVFVAAIGIAAFVAAMSVLTWLSSAADRASAFWDSWGGLVVQIGFWLAGITFAAYLVLRLVSLVLGSSRKRRQL